MTLKIITMKNNRRFKFNIEACNKGTTNIQYLTFAFIVVIFLSLYFQIVNLKAVKI